MLWEMRIWFLLCASTVVFQCTPTSFDQSISLLLQMHDVFECQYSFLLDEFKPVFGLKPLHVMDLLEFLFTCDSPLFLEHLQACLPSHFLSHKKVLSKQGHSLCPFVAIAALGLWQSFFPSQFFIEEQPPALSLWKASSSSSSPVLGSNCKRRTSSVSIFPLMLKTLYSFLVGFSEFHPYPLAKLVCWDLVGPSVWCPHPHSSCLPILPLCMLVDHPIL